MATLATQQIQNFYDLHKNVHIQGIIIILEGRKELFLRRCNTVMTGC